jgi:hypothetical protein
MVADFEEGRIISEMNDLDDEIKTILISIHRINFTNYSHKDNLVRESVLNRILDRLQQLKYHQEMRLKLHRQKVKESGIKF